MSITKEIIEDKIEVVGPYKIIQVRYATVIKENGVEISRSYVRDSFPPNKDISDASENVQAMARQFHTDAVKKAYAEHIAKA